VLTEMVESSFLLRGLSVGGVSLGLGLLLCRYRLLTCPTRDKVLTELVVFAIYDRVPGKCRFFYYSCAVNDAYTTIAS